MAISWCKRNNQLVTATYDKRIQLWTVGTPYTLSNIFSVELPTTVPRAVYFHGADVLVFGMYDGEIHTLRGKDGVILATKTIGRMIGNAAIDAACSSFVIDNAVNGFSLHRMEDASVIAEGGSMVVGGGNDGSIYVFDKGTTGRVQTVTTYDAGEAHYIFAATSSNENDISISIWKKMASTSRRHQRKRGRPTALSILRAAWHTIPHLTALVAIVMFALQMRGEDGAINPLTWKRNPISTYPMPRVIVHTSRKLHGEHDIGESGVGYGEDPREYE
ncbi:hypothetical protein EDC04DRAFT_2685722 [Pisolithus marmoratus]|nr:hypothetical protein EDC04DRAFT_2685722 [Pisolithus marmoratus]